jgi:hypothetical protein
MDVSGRRIRIMAEKRDTVGSLADRFDAGILRRAAG